MPQKIEGATMQCNNCDAELICRTKDYGGGYEPILQWQNYDGTAHYSTKDGKKFTCTIPDKEPTISPESKVTEITKASSKKRNKNNFKCRDCNTEWVTPIPSLAETQAVHTKGNPGHRVIVLQGLESGEVEHS